MNKLIRPKKEQTGVILVICLMMLLLLTLMGVSGMGSTALEEKMASNMRDRNIAFQAAEAALRHGEQFIELGNANYNLVNMDNPQGPFDIPNTGNIAGLSAQPTYTVTLIASEQISGSYYMTFQVTATGLGATSTSVVQLQTIYVVLYNPVI